MRRSCLGLDKLFPIRRRTAASSRLSSRRRRSTVAFASEHLEPRCLLDARVIITEILASNNEGLEDEDGERPDWIELYNAGDAPADLSGWHLTDDRRDPAKWTFPSVTLQPEQYRVVFASGKNRVDPSSPLHTNFQLQAEGEYVALTRPDRSVTFELAPQFPAQHTDIAYGYPQGAGEQMLIGLDAPVRVLVPTAENGADQLGTQWTGVSFDDSGWIAGTGAVGYGGASFEAIVGTNIRQQHSGVNATAYIRIPFTAVGARSIYSLTLGVRYDDGYVAYLNGVEVARRNAPTPLGWDSRATAAHTDSRAVEFEDVDISASIDQLREGPNVLAIHGMNQQTNGTDFLMQAQLRGGRPAGPPADTAGYIEQPTPGQPNGLVSYAGVVAPVVTSVQRGFYDQPQDVMLSTVTPGATIVYTTDGSEPALDNGVLIAPPSPNQRPSTVVPVAKTTTLRVRAFHENFIPTRIQTHTYLFPNDVIRQDVQATLDAGFPATWRRVPADYGMDPKVIGPNDLYDGEFANQIIDSLKAVPSISIVTKLDNLFGDQGIYTNSTRTGFAWERPTSVELLFPDSGSNVQANAGLRIAGDNVRDFANSKKQSFRLEFRQQYGDAKLRYPVFGNDATDRFDTLILRGGYNDAWVHTPTTTQYIRDQWARTTQLAMGQPSAHGRWMHVYLNGFYWGLYNVVERPDESFASTYYGGDKDEWDILNTGNLRSGTREAWSTLQSLARAVNNPDQQQSNAELLRLLGKNPDGTDNSEFETLLDVHNYIDYLIMNFYGGNVDWPGRNYYVARQRGPESTGFKYHGWDTEKILDHGEGSTLNTNQTGVADGVAQVYRFLRSNDEFRLMFADHVQRHFFHGGVLYVDPDNPQWDPEHPERNVPAARYNQLAQDIELALVAESARWGDTQSTSTRNDRRTFTPREWRTMRDRLFANYFPRRSAIVLEQFKRAGLYPQVAAPEFSQHGGPVDAGFQLTIDASGDVYYTLDGTDPRLSALLPGVTQAGIAPTAIRYTGPITLNQHTIVKARTLVDGQWSALNEGAFTIGVPSVRISEIMYHPRDPEEGGLLEDDDFEYIELVNISPTQPVNLEGFRFTRGIEFQFPSVVLRPGERVVVVHNQSAFQQRYGTEIRIAGQYGGTVEDLKLSNGGETIRLEDPLGQLVQQFTYDDAWIRSTDGDGYSLTIIDPNGPSDRWDLAEAWRASRAVDGSPGRDDGIGDFDRNGRLDAVDIELFCQGHRAGDRQFDFTNDQIVDQSDLAFLIENVFGTYFGDTNLDGAFSSSDFVSVFQAGEYEDEITGNSTWPEGDWNCDGEFDSSDLVVAFKAGGFERPRRGARAAAALTDDVAADVASAANRPAGGRLRRVTPRAATATDALERDRHRRDLLESHVLARDRIFASSPLDWRWPSEGHADVVSDLLALEVGRFPLYMLTRER